jgi:hypothetical protein
MSGSAGLSRVVDAPGKLQVQAEAEADVMLTALGNYVENITKGNAAILLSAGMEVRAAAAPIGPMPQSQSLAATEGPNRGVNRRCPERLSFGEFVLNLRLCGHSAPRRA